MTAARFCELYTAYNGEKIDNVKQLLLVQFTGADLKKFIDFCINEEQKVQEELEKKIKEDFDKLENWDEEEDDEDRSHLGMDYDDDEWEDEDDEDDED